MHRTAIPLAFVVAASLACPEAAAAPFGKNLAFRSAVEVQPEDDPALTGEAEPASEGSPYGAEPQPYGDPGAVGQPEGPAAEAPVYAPPPPRRSRRKGLMIAGWSMFGGSYLFTALVAGIVHDTCNLGNAPNCKRAAGLSLIPLVGPFMSIPYLKTEAIIPKVFISIPALVQIAGLTMAIVGTVQFVNDGKASRVADIDGFKLGSTRLRLGVTPTRFMDGGTFTLGARF